MTDTDTQPTPRIHGLNARQEDFFRTHDLGTLLLRPPERIVHPYAWLGHLPFAQTLMRIMQPRVVVELGTHTGNSFCSFCQAAVSDHLDTRCYAIDTWQGDEQAGYYGNDVYDELAPFVQSRFGNFAELLRMTFEDALSQFEDGSVDLLHIDGLHTYEAVRRDYETWKDKLSPRSVVLFHDTRVLDRDFGVHEFWAELRCEHPGFEFLHSHGLGILLTGPEITAGVANFINLAVEDPHAIQLLYERASQLWLSGDALAYQRRFGTAPQSTSLATNLDCELYLDHGQGFSENAKLISQITLKERKGKVCFDLGRFANGLTGLRFDPGAEPIALCGLQVKARRRDGTSTKIKQKLDSSFYRDHDTALFPADPWLEFVPTEGELDSIEFELEVAATGTALTDMLISKFQTVAGDLAAKGSLIRAQKAEIDSKEAAARKLWDDLATKDFLIKEQQAEIESKEAAARKLWDDVAAKDSVIGRLRQDLSWVTSHPVYPLLKKLRLIRDASTKSGKQ